MFSAYTNQKIPRSVLGVLYSGRQACGEQDGRLAPAYFSQEYKYFDHHICPQLKTRLLFKIWFAKVFYKHQFHHWFLYSMQKRGVSRLFVQNFLSRTTEKFRWGTLRWIRKFRVAKNFMHKKGISLNSVEKSLSHSADKIRRRTLLCFERILVSKIFKQRRGEASRFCRNFFYLTGPKKLRQGTILCFRKFLVGKNIIWIRGGGGWGITIFRRSFCLTVPKYFIGEHFGVSENFFYRKFSCIRGGGGHLGFVEFFCLTGPKRKAL